MKAFPHELKQAFPSYGPDWDRAVVMGVVVSLLLENLALTPHQRLQQLQELVDESEKLDRLVKARDSIR